MVIETWIGTAVTVRDVASAELTIGEPDMPAYRPGAASEKLIGEA